MFCHSPQYPPTSVLVSDSGASNTGSACSVSGLAHRQDLLSQQGQSFTESRTICMHGGSHVQHHKAAGFSDEVSRLAVAPRRPSTNRMYDDRWLHFTHWAAREGFDPLSPTAAQIATFLYSLFATHGSSPQTVKGFRTCLRLVLNRTGKAKVVQHKTVSNMIASMELQRP